MNARQSICLLMLIPALSFPVRAQQDRDDRSESDRVVVTPAMRQAAIELFVAAQACAEIDDFACARGLIYEVTAIPDLNDYENQQFWNFRAFVEYSEGNVDQAMLSYENMLRLADLRPGMERSTLLMLSQLCIAEEQYGRALEALDRQIPESEYQLQIHEAAHASGRLTEGDQLISLAALLFFADRPLAALRDVDKGLESGVIEPGDQSLSLRQQLESAIQSPDVESAPAPVEPAPGAAASPQPLPPTAF